MNQVNKYFIAEKNESVLFVVVGVIAIILSAYFLWKVRQPFYNGLSYALILIALIQLVVGSSVYFRSPKDIIRVNNLVCNEPSKIKSEEIPRMKVVMKNFIIYRWVEIVILLIGVFLYFYFQPLSILKGIGLGLMMQSGIMLILDYFAESRGKIYIDYLLNING